MSNAYRHTAGLSGGTRTPEQIAAERKQTSQALALTDTNLPKKLPRSGAEEHSLAAEFLSKLTFFTYSDRHKSLPLVICLLVRLSLEHGLTAESANGFTFYGLLLALDGDRLLRPLLEPMEDPGPAAQVQEDARQVVGELLGSDAQLAESVQHDLSGISTRGDMGCDLRTQPPLDRKSTRLNSSH